MKKDNVIVEDNIHNVQNLNENILNNDEDLINLNVFANKRLLIKDYLIHLESLLNKEKNNNIKIKKN